MQRWRDSGRRQGTAVAHVYGGGATYRTSSSLGAALDPTAHGAQSQPEPGVTLSENPYPPAPTLPQAPQPLQRPVGNGFGIASMILGIVTMAGFAIPFLNYLTIVTGLAGVILGIVGLVIKFRPRKAAIAGVILSGLGLLLSIILVVVYVAAFNSVAAAIKDESVPVASASPDGSSSTKDATDSSSSFIDGTLTTPDMKIVITDRKVIAVGEPGNEYGTEPVVAFWYSVTNLTDKKLDPTTAWIGAITVFQDNNANSLNKLDVASLPDQKFLDTQLEQIKNGGTVENAVAYGLTDTTTPVDLVASDDFGITEIGKLSYPLQ